MKFSIKAGLRLSAACAAIAVCTPAFAQDAPQDDAGLEDTAEIIVTATKREQTLQDVPISVSVTTADAVERAQVRDLIDLQTLVPSLKVGQLQSSANTNFVIRGFGNGANNAGIEPSVGVFIDGVYRSRSAAQIGDLPNIRRVEVLRGPQSTLFGKNASAGIISIVTQEPQFEFGGSAELSYGNYNAIVAKASVTGPIAETLAFSLAGSYNKRDGYGRDLNLNKDTNDRNRYGVRGQLLWEPNDALKLRIIGDYDKIDEVCCTVVNIFDGPTGAAVRAVGGRINSNQPFSYDSYTNFESTNKIDNYGVSAQFDYDLNDAISLTSITAYRGVKSNTNQDSDFTSADLIGSNINKTDIKTFTQELRIASDFDGIFNFLLGGFFFKEKIDIDVGLTFGRDFRNYANALTDNPATLAFDPVYIALEPTLRLLSGLPAATTATQFGGQGQGRFERYDYKNTAASLFGQIDITPTEALTLTAGFNYTNDRKTVAQNNRSTDVFSSIDLVQAGANAGFAPAARTVPCGGANIINGVNCNGFLGLRPLQFLPPYLNFPNAVENGKTKDSDLSYTLRLAYKFSRKLSGYATYATGFKATSWNLSTDSRPFASTFIPGSPAQIPAPAASAIRTALGANLPVNLTSGTRYAEPEDAIVYEIGLKGNFDGFGFNLALFKQSLKGFQGNIFNGTGFVLANAEEQSTNGLELDVTISPVKALNFTASLTYLDPKFDSFTGGSAFNPATNNVVPTNLTGQTPTGISKYSVAVGATYTADLGNDNALIFHADYALSSAYQIAAGLPNKAEPESLNASVAYAFSNGLEFSLWGRNLTEPKFNPVIFPSVAQSGSLSGYPSPPKTYGASARFKF